MSIKQALNFDRGHIILTNASHFVLGFGVAVLLQHYMAGEAFLPIIVGWILVGFSLMVHLYSWNKR